MDCQGLIRRRIMSVVVFFFCLFIGSELAFAQSADDYFNQGKEALENYDLLTANSRFSSALNIDPGHQKANLFYALTRILMISKSTYFNNLLDRFGVSKSGRNIFNWTADFKRDSKGKIILPSTSPTGSEFQVFLKNNILPQINGALGNLSKVTDTGLQIFYKWVLETGTGSMGGSTLTDSTKHWEFGEWEGCKLIVEGTEYAITENSANTITVSGTLPPGTHNYKIFEDVEIDYSDVLVFQGSLYGAKAAILILNAYHLDFIDIDKIVSLVNAGELNIQTHIINAYKSFLKLLPTSQLSLAIAKEAMSNAIDYFEMAIDSIVGEGDDQTDDLFVIEQASDPCKSGEQYYRNLLEDLRNALSGPTFIRMKTHWEGEGCVVDDGIDVNLSEFFDDPKNLRDYLPTFIGDNYIKRNSFSDPTFGGILPNMTKSELEKMFDQETRDYFPISLVPYDDFSGSSINPDKWQNGDLVREIQNGKLVSKVATYGSRIWNPLFFQDPTSINFIEADVVINQIQDQFNPNDPTNIYSFPNARLAGNFYNDGTATGPGSYKGEVQVALWIGKYMGQIRAEWVVFKAPDDQGTNWPWIARGYFSNPISLNTTYKLSILFEPTLGKFTFKVNENEATWISPDTIYASNMPWKGIATQGWCSPLGAPLTGEITASFDNVIAKDESGNTIISDNFSSPNIDPAKWMNYEVVREISGGKFRSKVRTSSGSYSQTNSDVGFLYHSEINAIQTKVTPISYNNPNGVMSGARIFGLFYNTLGSEGQGSLGNVVAQISIGGTGTIPVAAWSVVQLMNPEGTQVWPIKTGVFNTPIILGKTYTLFLGWDGMKFTFKMNNEVVNYWPEGPTYKPTVQWKGMGTWIWNPWGREGTIEALFDDVMVSGPVLSVYPRQYSFGDVIINTTALKTFTITNTGSKYVSISSIDRLGDQKFNIIGQNFPVTIAPNGKLTFSTSFLPSEAGDFIALLRIIINAYGQPVLYVPLRGKGIIETVPIHRDSPGEGQSYILCSLYSPNSPPTFAWHAEETFKGYQLQFSSTNNFSRIPVKLVAAGTATTLPIPNAFWKMILGIPGELGGTVYWRIVGTRLNNSVAISEVYTIIVNAPVAVGNLQISPTSKTTIPTLSWQNNCNTTFNVWFGNNSNFTGGKKIYLRFSIPNPNTNGGSFTKILTRAQWATIRSLVGNNAGSTVYWYVESWDALLRYRKTEVMSFILNS